MDFQLHYTVHCAENIVFARLHTGSVSAERVGQGEVGRGDINHHDMHMVAARLGCERVTVGTEWATSHPDSMDRLTKHYYELTSAKEGCLGSERVYDN